MRHILAAAVAAGLSAGAAQAAVVDLTYTVEAQVTDYSYYDQHEGTPMYATPYYGPEVGEILFYSFQVDADTEAGSGFDSVKIDTASERHYSTSYDVAMYEAFDPSTGAIDYLARPNMEESQRFVLSADGSGWGYDGVGYTEYLNFVSVNLDVLSWQVDGLPEVAPVPLPASMPLLGIGLAAVGFVSRRRRT